MIHAKVCAAVRLYWASLELTLSLLSMRTSVLLRRVVGHCLLYFPCHLLYCIAIDRKIKRWTSPPPLHTKGSSVDSVTLPTTYNFCWGWKKKQRQSEVTPAVHSCLVSHEEYVTFTFFFFMGVWHVFFSLLSKISPCSRWVCQYVHFFPVLHFFFPCSLSWCMSLWRKKWVNLAFIDD